MIRYQPPHSQKIVSSHRRIKECMASAMLEMAHGGVAVTAETLQQRGFTPAAVTRFWREAANMARRRSIRRLEATS